MWKHWSPKWTKKKGGELQLRCAVKNKQHKMVVYVNCVMQFHRVRISKAISFICTRCVWPFSLNHPLALCPIDPDSSKVIDKIGFIAIASHSFPDSFFKITLWARVTIKLVFIGRKRAEKNYSRKKIPQIRLVQQSRTNKRQKPADTQRQKMLEKPVFHSGPFNDSRCRDKLSPFRLLAKWLCKK